MPKLVLLGTRVENAKETDRCINPERAGLGRQIAPAALLLRFLPSRFDGNRHSGLDERGSMIREMPNGRYRLYSQKKDPKTGRRRNLGTFPTRSVAEKHERAVQFFKRH